MDLALTYTAWATTNDSMTGADAGISVSESEVDSDGYREEKGFVFHSDRQDWPEWNADAADALLGSMGYHRVEQWTESGGQMAATVELD